MNKRMTLIEKLGKLSDEYFNLYTCYGDRADLNCSGAVDEVINIVKEHSDWVSTDEQLPYAEEMLTNHYDPKDFYEIILKTGELVILLQSLKLVIPLQSHEK